MFGRSSSGGFKPVPFQSQAKTGGVPKWVQLILFGIGLGALGLFLIQENVLPKRLSSSKSAELQEHLKVANTDREGLRRESTELKAKLQQAEAASKKAQADLQAVQTSNEKLQKNLSQFVGALPPDPRGGPVGIRAGSFSTQGAQLAYNVILTRNVKVGDQMSGSMVLVVMGQKAGGRNETVSLPAVPLEMDNYQQLAGSVNLPEGMVPREITVKILRGSGELLSLRVYRI
jgi:hypothetical protein